MSDYGDDVSEAESVASLLQHSLENEEKKKQNIGSSSFEEEGNVQYGDDKMTRAELHEKFKHAIFQDVSNDKMYILVIKKSATNENDRG